MSDVINLLDIAEQSYTVAELARMGEQIKKEDKGMFEVDKENYKRFKKICNFLIELVEENGGEVISKETSPSDFHASITVRTGMISLIGEEMDRFKEAVSEMDAIDIEITKSKNVAISAKVNYVWKRC